MWRQRTASSQLNNYEQLKQVALSFVPSEHDACLSVCLSVDVSVPQPAPGFYSSREQLLLVSNSCWHIPSLTVASQCHTFPEATRTGIERRWEILSAHQIMKTNYTNPRIKNTFITQFLLRVSTIAAIFRYNIKILQKCIAEDSRVAEACMRRWIISVSLVYVFVCFTVGIIWWNHKVYNETVLRQTFTQPKAAYAL